MFTIYFIFKTFGEKYSLLLISTSFYCGTLLSNISSVIFYFNKNNVYQTMELLNTSDIKSVIKQCGRFELLEFKMGNYSDTLIGYLSDHLRLTAKVEENGKQKELTFFIKCMPKDKWIAEFLRESSFFRKEYVMLSKLFTQFENYEGKYKWRPKAFLVGEDIIVFEDLKKLGYKMPNHVSTMSYKEMMATIQTVARFHAQSFILEEKKSYNLKKPYRIWDEYSQYLQETNNKDWRNAGRNAAVEFLKVYSKYNSQPNFSKNITDLFNSLFDDAFNLTKPSSKYRNTVVHRDLWSNNILLKSENENCHALIVDFQTVLYCPPTMDLASVIYFNTTKSFRDNHVNAVLEFYYEALSKEVEDAVKVDFATILSKADFRASFKESVQFGMTQAAIIVPIIAMSAEKRGQLFCDSESIHKINNVSRSGEIIELAQEDAAYRFRLKELFEDIVDRYYLSEA